ncbi:MAG TPA: transcription antitermination factor NusB [Ignavibacteriaceae bacterium]|jgi:N utilization substance protein B|nr:transcription antitermination factor NusB [Ignavibacteriaceae bacterium]
MFRRRIVRERVLQILYAFELNSDSLQLLTEGILSDLEDAVDKKFANDLVNRVIIHHKELDSKIKERVDNWEMGRIALIDKLLLRMGICELIYFPDIPPKVSINECIEIAKVYSTAGSGKFINGILDAILNELKHDGKLKKSGRGLVEETISKQPRKSKLK